MKKRIVISTIVLALVAAVSVPWYLLHQTNERMAREKEQAIASGKFVAQYGTNANVLRTETLDKVMVAYWTDNTSLHVSLGLGSAWVEIYRGPLPTK